MDISEIQIMVGREYPEKIGSTFTIHVIALLGCLTTLLGILSFQTKINYNFDCSNIFE